MSYRLEQSVSDISFLKGAKLTGIKKRAANGEYDIEALVLTFELPEPIVDADTGKPVKKVDFEVWQDPEGNGPGFLALTGMK